VARSSRTPFVFLVVGLLGGGLLCLLLINTILDTGSYQITQLQQENVTLAQQTQELQARVAQEESPTVLAAKASQLGMQEPGLLRFLDLRKGKIEREPAHAPGVSVYPPGYTP
jgi:cell division protein FtsB